MAQLKDIHRGAFEWHPRRSNEVTIETIYEHAMPNTTNRMRAEAVAAELETEAAAKTLPATAEPARPVDNNL